MACSSCQKEWYFVVDGVEHVATSHYRAHQLRKQLGAPGAAIKSRPKPKATR
jgi:hypothetical protein